MRHVFVSLLALVAANPALAEDVFTQAPVAGVTVYPSGAEIVHRAYVALSAGEHRVFLPYAGMDNLSALPRIATSGGVTIGAIGLQRGVDLDRDAILTPPQAEALAALETARGALEAAEDALATGGAEAKALAARLAFLGAVTPGEGADPAAILALAEAVTTGTAETHARLVAAEAALRPLAKARDEAAEALAAAERAFDRLAPPAAVSDVLVLEVSVAEDGPVGFELTELTPDAGWQMDYDLDLDRATGALTIARKVLVTQDTGRAWSDVTLTLSTTRPGEAVGPSPVEPDRARIFEPMDYARTESRMPMLEMAAPAPMVAADMKTASLEVDGLALSYRYPEAVSLASGEASELALDTLSVAATPAVHAAPRWDATAYTVATFTNTTGEPVLPGMANILRDGHLVGRDWVEMIPAGAEVTLPFGAIEGIRLATLFERNEEGDSGLISRSNTRDQRISFTVENLTDEPQEVRALFPLTFSEQEDLRVKVTPSPAPTETDLERKRGVSAWDLALAPGEKAEVSIRVQLDWPEGMELGWAP